MKWILWAMSALILVGCAAGESADFAASQKSSDSPSAKPEVAAKYANGQGREQAPSGPGAADTNMHTAANVIQNRMVIRRAELTLRVDNVEKGEKQVQAIVSGLGGYVDSANSSDLDSEHPTLTISMRVPAQAFDQAMNKIEALGVRTSKNVSSEDVTEQVVDMDARIKSMLVQEQTYRALLKDARKLDDIISLQQQLTSVRGQIESIQGQRKSLATQAALSTISLTLTQSAVINKPAKDPNWLAQSWGEATTEMGGFMRSLATFGIWMIVFSPLWGPLLWLLVRAVRPRKTAREVAL